MSSALPIADPAPLDGVLPASVANDADARNFGVYLHVPFCRVRCGYCDFNTYTSEELRGAKRSDYAGQAMQEVALAGQVMRSRSEERRVGKECRCGRRPGQSKEKGRGGAADH